MSHEILPPLLTLEDVRRSFGGVQAAQQVNLAVHSGTVHGLIGPNGAGKTTILNLVSGLLNPDAGSICLDGHRIDTLPAYRIAQLGVRRTYQSIRLFGALSVRENVMVGLHNQRSDSLWQRLCFSRAGRRAELEVDARVAEVLDRVGLGARARAHARDLAYGEQRRLEIARALASRPRLLMLDEPTAGMSVGEASQVGELVRSIAAEGTAVLLVEHNLELVMRIAGTLTVLDFGQVLASGAPEAIQHDPAVVEAYLGTDE